MSSPYVEYSTEWIKSTHMHSLYWSSSYNCLQLAVLASNTKHPCTDFLNFYCHQDKHNKHFDIHATQYTHIWNRHSFCYLHCQMWLKVPASLHSLQASKVINCSTRVTIIKSMQIQQCTHYAYELPYFTWKNFRRHTNNQWRTRCSANGQECEVGTMVPLLHTSVIISYSRDS